MRLSHIVAFAAVAGVSAMILSCNRGGIRIGPLTGDPLDPEVYRAQIVAIDAIVFEDGSLGEAERGELANTLQVLGRSAATDPTNTIASSLGRDLQILASMARHTKVGTPLSGSRLQLEWVRIRGSLFADASWFRQSSADPIESAEAGPPSSLRPASDEERRNLGSAIASLGSLIKRAREDLPNEYDSEAHRQYLVDTERELVLDSLRLGPPVAASGIDVYFKAAHGYATEGVEEVRTQARLGPGAPRKRREDLLAKAEEHLGQAREAMGKMMR
jgi:hypothetical protein